MKDRAMQALYVLALDPIAEVRADNHSYGFRRERATADAIGQCYTVLGWKRSAEWILEADIEGCFDNINHEWLLQNIPMNKTILKKWLEAGYMEYSNIYATTSGTPQGGIISPLLANMTLDGLGRILSERFPKNVSHRKPQYRINFVRYADDFIITGKTKELLEQEVLPIVERFLQSRGLKLSKAKTKITHIDEGFDFLGQTIQKYNGKLIIKPSKTSMKSVLKRIREIAKRNKMATQVQLINLLNPLIKGWAAYHRHVVSKVIFRKLRHETTMILWRWCKSRHPYKSRRWIKNRYFRRIDGVDWCFADYPSKKVPGEKFKVYRISDPNKIPIKRHVKILSEANPYDQNWESYFEKRLKLKMLNTLSNGSKAQSLWKKQKGKCPICSQDLTLESDWDMHHIIPRAQGGNDGSSNLMMLHIQCHKQIHYQGFKV